jgi:hypothetical protein
LSTPAKKRWRKALAACRKRVRRQRARHYYQ